MRSPQEFTDTVYTCCSENRFDAFLKWLQVPDIPQTNQHLKSERRVTFPTGQSDSGFDRDWKNAYYTEFSIITQTKPFLFAGKIYPFTAIPDMS